VKKLEFFAAKEYLYVRSQGLGFGSLIRTVKNPWICGAMVLSLRALVPSPSVAEMAMWGTKAMKM
jgi:hypothetical protein